tara:strand:- start:48 stop:566 length:519 start_codon:yes stop_codon:yes gene_type:complete
MAIKFQTKEPRTLCFPYADYLEVNGQYGTQFLYTVEAEGLRDRLYATPKLHQALQTTGITAGDLVTITKIETEGNRMGWTVEVEGLPVPEPEAEATEGVSAPRPEANGKPAFAEMEDMIGRCLKASWAAWQGLDEEFAFSSEDVRAVGITLFLECARKGCLPQVEERQSVLA